MRSEQQIHQGSVLNTAQAAPTVSFAVRKSFSMQMVIDFLTNLEKLPRIRAHAVNEEVSA